MTGTVYYLAYGSNLHPARLQARLPSSVLVARVEIPGRMLVYHKRGQDGSGKCNLVETDSGALSYGALYQLDSRDVETLDRIEAGYRRADISLLMDGQQVSAFTYLARESMIAPQLRPFDWYQKLVIVGAQYLGIHSGYLQQLQCWPCLYDTDASRRTQQLQLLLDIEISISGNQLKPQCHATVTQWG